MKETASGSQKVAIWAAIVIGIAIFVAVIVVEQPRFRPRSLEGAVIVASPNSRKQLPIPNVEITASAGNHTAQAKSDASGLFQVNWPDGIWRGEEVTLSFHHPDYQPLEIKQPFTDRLYIARMAPDASNDGESKGTDSTLANIRIRYAVKATTTINIGSTAKILEVPNVGNVLCDKASPCSPDGKWKAAIGTTSIDAGEGQEFQDVRVSCIAGPCPFTKVESDGFSHGGRKIAVSVRAWSDGVTFLVEAEVVHTMISDAIREAYPSIFGRDMTFTLPPTGQGPSIEAEVNGLEIVFPLGPDLTLSWATCSVQVAANRAKLYSCQLKPGFRFK